MAQDNDKTHITLDMSQQETMTKLLLNNAQNVYDNNKFCDVTFIVGLEKAEFPVARTLFAINSEYFEKMLYNGHFKESNIKCIEEPDVTPAAFKFIQQLFYRLNPFLNETNVFDVLYASKKYLLPTLESICTEFIGPNFSKIQFKSPYAQIMIELIQKDSLKTQEEEIWSGCKQWSFNQISSEKKQEIKDEEMKDEEVLWSEQAIKNMRKFTPYIRFTLMDKAFFVQTIAGCGVLTMEEEREIALYSMCLNKNMRFNTKKRAYKAIKYTVKTPSKPYHGFPNKYKVLITSRLTEGCAATESKGRNWVEASFYTKCIITRIEIGPADKNMKADKNPYGGWGPKYYLNELLVEYKSSNGNWTYLMILPQFKPNEIKSFDVNIKTNALRIISGSSTYVGIGCWRIYGWTM